MTAGAPPAMQGNFWKACKAGVKVSHGAGSGVSKHGNNEQESVLIDDQGRQVCRYRCLDVSPLDDIEELPDVDFVMKGGKVYNQ